MPSSGSGGISGWHLVGHTLAVIAGIGSFLMLGITLTINRIDDLAERTGSVEQRIGSVDQQMGSMEQAVSSLDQRVISLGGRMEIVQGDVSETRVLVSAIAASLEGQPRPEPR